MDAPGLKRPAESCSEVTQNQEHHLSPPFKKQRTTNPQSNGHHRSPHNQRKQRSKPPTANTGGYRSLNPIGDLKSGLDFLLAGQFSKEAAHHAKELMKLVYGVQTPDANNRVSPMAQSLSTPDQHEQTSELPKRQSYTDLPLPTSSQQAIAADSRTEPGMEKMFLGDIGVHPGRPTTTDILQKKLPTLPPISDLALLSAPFTHSSTLPAYVPRTNLNCYENLEFLGDAYLEIAASRLIHRSFPDLAVGQWAQLREALICNDNLSKYGRAYGFDKQVIVTQQERDTPKTFTKILADVFEAYVAAIMLSHPKEGFSIIENWLSDLFQPTIKEWFDKRGNAEHLEHVNQDAKADLSRLIGTKGVKIEYLEEKPMEMIKQGNTQKFFMGAFYTGFGREKLRLGGAFGRSKQIGGTAAAKDALSNNAILIKELHTLKLEHDKYLKSVKRDLKKDTRREADPQKITTSGIPEPA